MLVRVGTVHPRACITKLARNLRMNVETLVAIRALGEVLALLSRMVILTLISGKVAFGPMLTSDLALISLANTLLGSLSQISFSFILNLILIL